MKIPKSPLFADLTNKPFGYWTALRYLGKGKWECRCECGTVREVDGQSLRQEKSVSCGCSWSRRTLKEEFFSRLVAGDVEDCWPWKDHEQGYGQMMFNHESYSAHRLSWEFHRGPVPSGIHVLHHCDNPPCCNPAHLFLGTNLDNMTDKVSKGRQAKGGAVRKNHSHLHGEKIGTAKITAETVMEIRRLDAAGKHPAKIAKEVGVVERYVPLIASGKCWKHLPLLYTGDRRNRPCPKCGIIFATRGGLFYKHIDKCDLLLGKS
jgi:hypothetical protein